VNRFDEIPHIAARYRRRRERYAGTGLWPSETLRSSFEKAVVSHPGQNWTFAVGDEEIRLTMAELADAAYAFGRLLAGIGPDPQDPVVAIALANSPGAFTAFHGAQLAQQVAFPVSMREGRESLGELLEAVGVNGLVVAASDKERIGWGRDYVASGVLARLWLVDDRGQVHADQTGESNAADTVPGPDEDGVHLISYTSGSTRRPKVVLHTDAQLLAESLSTKAILDAWGTVLVPSPVGHITGILHLLVIPLLRPADVVSMDRWSADLAVDLCRRLGAECVAGTSLYYQAMRSVSADLGGLRGGLAGGGPVAPLIVERLDQEIGARLVRAYGSTEHPSITQSLPSDPLFDRAFTDGRTCPGVELRVIDPLGQPVPPGTGGEILSRGPDSMAGYLDPDLDAQSCDEDDWLRTGDVGVLDDAGRLTISDRVKDIVIRGGENISAKEVEDLVHEWDLIEEACVIGVPDATYGERVCLYVRARCRVTLEDLRAFLSTTRLEKYKWPEYLVALDEDFPRSASGKVRKQSLRDSWASGNAG
jgi:acyl-CoA synthetase (AMP-forming)/AMP-acid ligase II